MTDLHKKILVVDDEIKICEVIRSYLEHSGYEVFESYNGRVAIDMFDKINPNLIILDLMMPDITGEDVCKKIRKKSRIPIIMLTAKVEEEDILNGLDIGADDYITKPFSPKQLVARVAALLRRADGEMSPLANTLSFNNDELILDLLKHEIHLNNNILKLTPNEYKIMSTMAANPSKVFTREELIYFVLGEDYEGYDRTIDTHIKNLRKKLEMFSSSEYIITVHGTGYRFGGD